MQVKEKIKPKPGQESAWDYPRPPRLEKSDAHIQIIFNNEIIVDKVRPCSIGRDLTNEIIGSSGGSKTSTPPQSGSSSDRATPVVVSICQK